MQRISPWRCFFVLLALLVSAKVSAGADTPFDRDGFFPIVLYCHWDRTTEKRMIEVIDNSQEHGFNTVNIAGQDKRAAALQAYAQSKGMAVSGFCYRLIDFKQLDAPGRCVHSPEYKTRLHKFLEPRRKAYESLSRPWAVTLTDEPYVDNRHDHRSAVSGHVGFVCHCDHCRQAFKAKYGVELPEKMPPIDQPEPRGQYVDFYNDYWAKVWRLSCEYMKANKPDLAIANTYTETVCLGRHVDLAFGDLLSWSQPLDWIAADIYPYYFGRNENDIEAIEWDMKRSRLLLAFLRCAAGEHEIPFAWWVGCTSSKEETPKAIRHMSYTAVGQGAQGLIGWGAYFPEGRPVLEYNPALWEDAGKTFRQLGKIGAELRQLEKTSRIALLCSETEGLFATPQTYTGPFYNDLVPAYDALLKAFGNADLIYERQIAAGKLDKYEALVMANVGHVAEGAAKAIEQFVSGGGVLISDRVPERDQNDKRSAIFAKLFGHSEHKRLHVGHPDKFPAVINSDYGKGKAALLRFRIGSFYNVPKTWQVLGAQLQAVGVYPSAVSSNPAVESNYLVAKDHFTVIAVNRTRAAAGAKITCYRPPFVPKRACDLLTGKEIPISCQTTSSPKSLSFNLDLKGLSGSAIGIYP